MVNVGVGDPDLLQRHAQLATGVFQQWQISAWVDDGGFFGFIAPDDGTVLLERGDGDGFVLKHTEMVAAIGAKKRGKPDLIYAIGRIHKC